MIQDALELEQNTVYFRALSELPSYWILFRLELEKGKSFKLMPNWPQLNVKADLYEGRNTEQDRDAVHGECILSGCSG